MFPILGIAIISYNLIPIKIKESESTNLDLKLYNNSLIYFNSTDKSISDKYKMILDQYDVEASNYENVTDGKIFAVSYD